MSRGLREMKADAQQDAIEDFTAAITLDPNLAEAYHQRAIARFAAGDTPGAIADIQATLQHEPRSFAAFETLAAIAESRKDWKGAYDGLAEGAGDRSQDAGRPGAPEGSAPPRAGRGGVAADLPVIASSYRPSVVADPPWMEPTPIVMAGLAPRTVHVFAVKDRKIWHGRHKARPCDGDDAHRR